jgi:hypothetical protein
MSSKALVVAVVIAAILGWTGFVTGGLAHPVTPSSGAGVPVVGVPASTAPTGAAPLAPSTPRNAPTTISSAARLAASLAHLPSAVSQAPWMQSLTQTGSGLGPLTSLPNLDLLEHPATSVAEQVYPGYVAQPAPLGLADFGLGVAPYAYTTSHFLGQVTFNAPPNVTDPASTRVVEPGGAALGYVGSMNEFGIQLNTVATNITFPGSNGGIFWTQNVVNWNDTGIHFVDDTFNVSSGSPVILPGTIYAGCNNNTSGVDRILEVYGGVFQCVGGTLPVSPAAYPVTLQLYNNASVNAQNRDQVAYGYRIVEAGTGRVFTGFSDVVVFNNPTAPSSAPSNAPGFSVSGLARTPLGLLRDAELDLVGDIGGDNAVFRSINGSLNLEYSNLSSGGWANVPSAYNFGADTGETSTGIADYWEPNETLVVNQGPSMLYGLWHAVPSVSVASGDLHLAGTITPSYGFVFVSNTPAVLDPLGGGNGSSGNATFDNMSWLPTNASGGFNTYLPPLGFPWATQYYVQAFADGTGEVNGTTVTANVTDYTLTLPLAPGTLNAPLYAFSNGQAAQLAQNVSGSSSVPYTFSGLVLNVNFSFNHLNDYDFPSFELVVAEGVSQALTVRDVAQGTDSPAGNYYIGDGPSAGLLSPGPMLLGPVRNYTSQVDLFDGSDGQVVDQTVNGEGEVVLWHEANATVSGLVVEFGSSGVFVGDCLGASVQNVDVLPYSAGVQDIGSTGTVVTNVEVAFWGLGVETYSTSDARYSGIDVGGALAVGVEGGSTYGPALSYYSLPGTAGSRISDSNATDAYTGIDLTLSQNVTISNVVTNDTELGIGLEGTTNVSVHGTSTIGGYAGLYLFDAVGTNVTGLEASDAQYGAWLVDNTSGTVISRSVFYGDSVYGVAIEDGSSGNLVYDNSFFLNDGSNFTYNPAHVQAYSVVGNAFSLGLVGNFWADWHPYVNGVLYPYPISNGVVDDHPLAYGPDTYVVTVSESGLPSTGKSWRLALGQASERTNGTPHTPTVTSLTFSLPNGSYGILISGPAGYRASAPIGTLAVDGANVTKSVTFTRGATYKLTLHETGLGPGTLWCATLGGAWESCSTRTTVTFANLTPAAYPFELGNVSSLTPLVKVGHTWRNASGIVLTHSTTLLVRYGYAVFFDAEGLSFLQSWGVSVGGQRYTTNSPDLTVYLANGTYTYHVHAPRGYLVSTLVGQFVIDGFSETFFLDFTPV